MRYWVSVFTMAACTTGALDVDKTPQDTSPHEDTGPTEEPPLDPIDERLMSHLVALQSIADANDGHRSVGSTGYDASTDYVWNTLTEFGLAPERHPFELSDYRPVGATLEVPGIALEEDEDYTLMWYSPGGDTTAALHPVDLMLPPSSTPNTSTSGCEEADFDGFPAGHIALIQRGSCTYEQKAQRASDR